MSTASTVSRLTGRNLIAGRWTPASGDQFESHNPAHWDEVIGVFPSAGPKEAEQAVIAAREAYPARPRTSRIRRAELLDNLAQIVKREQGRLAELMARECGQGTHQLSAEHYGRIVACEMGSKSAVIVCADARLDLAVTCGILSAFKTSGQRCVSASRILVHEKIFDSFAD